MIRAAFGGGREIAAKLETLSKRLNKRVTRDALTTGAYPIQATAQRLAPRRRPAPDMADHIEIGTARARPGETAAVKVGPTTDHHYAFFVEQGTVHMSAQPFLRPAFDQNFGKALDIIRDAFWTELAAVGVSQSSSVPTIPEALGDGDLV